MVLHLFSMELKCETRTNSTSADIAFTKDTLIPQNPIGLVLHVVQELLEPSVII